MMLMMTIKDTCDAQINTLLRVNQREFVEILKATIIL